MHHDLDLSTFAAELSNEGPNRLFAWTYRLLTDFQNEEMHPAMLHGLYFEPIDPGTSFSCDVSWHLITREQVDFSLNWRFDSTNRAHVELISLITQRAATRLVRSDVDDSSTFRCMHYAKPRCKLLVPAYSRPHRIFPHLRYMTSRTDNRADLSLLFRP